MLHPVRTATGWLGGRLVLFAAIAAVLALWSLYRPQLELYGARAGSWLPNAEFTRRLEASRAALELEAAARTAAIDRQLAAAPALGDAALAARIDRLALATRAAEARRRTDAARAVALLTGEGLESDLRLELELRLLAAERSAWESVRSARTLQAAELQELERAADAAYARAQSAYATRYLPAYRALRDFERATPGWSHGRLNPAWRRLDDAHRAALESYRADLRELAAARAARDAKRAARTLRARPVTLDTRELLAPLDAAIRERRERLTSSARLADAVRGALAQALAIVVVITLAPLAIKAFWYVVVAPWIARRPPIRLSDRPWPLAEPARRERISAVSQEVVLGDGEELLVHPEFLQSTATAGRKSTRWLLDWRLPFTSLAARLAALTRVREATGHSFVVSSRTDPLAEVGVLRVAADAAFVLQPRYLVGLVQPTGSPVRIVRHWRFGWSAFITLQFRYLVFHGPVTLLVQGCRGIRLEPAGHGRSVDQRATMGFSANLAHAPRRSETFGAYLLGLRGLFVDHFEGGPGVVLYEEMPYARRHGGLGGRGLEGFTDGVLRAFGI